MFSDEELQKKFSLILPHLNEQATRLYLGSEAQMLGRGGKQRVAKLAGVSRVRIDKGIAELSAGQTSKEEVPVSRIRKAGGGRKQHQKSQAGLMEALESIVAPHTMGDPMKVLLWSSKSLRNIEKSLKEKGYLVSYVTVGELLKSLGYSLQANKKTEEGSNDPDRNEQFEFINKTALSFMEDNAPVISVDCKKKELIGNFKNAGTDWFEKGKATEVKVHDFMDKELGKAVPYGVDDIAKNEGWVSVGISKDTAAFAVNSVRTWWQHMGKEQYPLANKLLVTADGGGSNNSRSRLWKKELQKLATELAMEIHVCHFPPGTSKWNKIEHRMFSYITKNWRAKPLESLEVIVNLIANTTTKKGLTIKAEADKNQYEKGLKVKDEELKKINLTTTEFRGEWNYKISP
jgi:hypothetical protein